MNEKSNVDFDSFVSTYDELLHERTNFFSDSEAYFARYKVEITKKLVKTTVKRIHEFGCGIGRNISFLQDFFPNAEIIGSDISEASINLAAHNNPGAVFYHESNSLDIGLFELIFVAGVFHHVPLKERVAVMQRLKSRLAPNGCLIIFEHNPYNPVTRKIVSNCPYDEDAILLTPKDLNQLIKNSGLSILSTKFCLFIPPKFKKLVSIERFLGLLPLGGQYYSLAQLP